MHSATNVLVAGFAHSAADTMRITDGMQGQSLCKGTPYLNPAGTLGEERVCLVGEPAVMDLNAMLKVAYEVGGQKK